VVEVLGNVEVEVDVVTSVVVVVATVVGPHSLSM
jgi:hypothetical protein